MAKSTVFIELPIKEKTQGRIRPPTMGQLHRKLIYLAFAFVLLGPGHSFPQSDIRNDIPPKQDGDPRGTFTLHVDE
ncbi:MAG TPA: hypothetical protein VGN34_34165, partial [Ktedonobacteraceae bacterium]